MTPLLQTTGLTKAFGGLVAVDHLDLAVEVGEIRGIIGPNGSGKTTVLNLVSGIYRPDSGEIRLDGQRLDRQSPHNIVKQGIARTFQNIRLFRRQSVLDNVKTAQYCRTRSGLLEVFLGLPRQRAEEQQAEEQARHWLDFVGLADRAEALPGDLPYGQQRLVEIARALATQPRVLLLDEPGAGMSLAEKQRLVELIIAVNREQGITIVIIEHDIRLISGLCHQVTVLDYGEAIASGSPDEVRANPAVIEAYLGRQRGAFPGPSGSTQPGFSAGGDDAKPG